MTERPIGDHYKRMKHLKKYVKDQTAINKMRIAGQKAASVLEMIDEHVKVGVSTDTLNTICHEYIVDELKCIPAPLNYKGFPKSICTSINQVVCHGIPCERKLKNGDIMNIDITVIHDGYHGDTSKMFLVGDKVSIISQRLCRVAQESLYLGIKMVKPGRDLKAIGRAISDYVRKFNYSSVEAFCGHGIGREFHEENFQVLHYDHPNIPSTILEEGLTFTIEPMINVGTEKVRILPDQWTAVTKDHKLSAQWEHTILVTKTGYEVLTQRPGEEI